MESNSNAVQHSFEVCDHERTAKTSANSHASSFSCNLDATLLEIGIILRKHCMPLISPQSNSASLPLLHRPSLFRCSWSPPSAHLRPPYLAAVLPVADANPHCIGLAVSPLKPLELGRLLEADQFSSISCAPAHAPCDDSLCTKTPGERQPRVLKKRKRKDEERRHRHPSMGAWRCRGRWGTLSTALNQRAAAHVRARKRRRCQLKTPPRAEDAPEDAGATVGAGLCLRPR